jgi:peroxiredoxin
VKAPELQMWDTSKQVVSLHRTQAEYTIVVFWDYECGHCSKMLPGLRDYYHEVKDKGVKVFAVCTKSDWDKWTKYIRDKNLDWINVNGSYSVNRYDTLYDIMSTPIIFLLDKEKKILAKKVELEQLKEILQMEMDLARNRDPFRRDD